ncbi:MAG TPA: hypothetical protein PLR99_21865 [Polyangiaceae bacterium]|nr:hypothetical protein [Polyangiaceae bacterium]
MSGVVVVAGLAFVTIVASLAVALGRLRRRVELEEAERTIAAEMGDQAWGRCGRWGREP